MQAKALEMFEQLEREAPGARVDKVRSLTELSQRTAFGSEWPH